MFRMAGQALGWLFLIAFAGVALLWQWAAENPLLAAVAAVLIAAYVAYAVHLDRVKRAERLVDAHVPDMSPVEYEQFVARLLKLAGWSVEHVGRQGDQGADVIGELRGFKAVFQVKLYRKRAGNDSVQQAVAARRHYGAQIVVVVAPNGFTPSAQALAASNGVHLLHHSALTTLEGAARIP